MKHHNRKVLLASDLHVHQHKNSASRLDDCIKCFEWIFSVARENGIKTIVFGGDLFQDRQKIQVISYQRAFEVLEANQDIDFWLLLGNHDLWFYDRWDVSSVYPLRALKNVHIIGKPSCVNIEGTDFDFLPYTHNPKESIEEHFKKKSEILIAHIAIDGAMLNTFHETIAEVSVECESDMVKMSKDMLMDWKKVFLGHYHAAQQLNECVEYIGSPLELNFGEAFQEKHVIILDLDTFEKEYVINNFSPKHLIIEENEIGNYSLENNFVHVICKDVNSSKTIELKNNLADMNLGSLEMKPKYHSGPLKITDQAKCDFQSGKIIEQFVESSKTRLNHSKLIDIGNKIMQLCEIN